MVLTMTTDNGGERRVERGELREKRGERRSN
jgi:hypothetical protein